MSTIIDFDKAVADPESVFETPAMVVTIPNLSDQQKIKILESWKQQAEHLQRSEAEGLDGGESSKLDQVLDALNAVQS